MNDVIIIKSLIFFMAIWGVSLILLWFRPRIEWFWKIAASLIYGFYIWFFFSELRTGLERLKSDWYISSLDFIRELAGIVFINLLFFWPLLLIVIFYKADDVAAEKLLKFISIATVVLWILFIIYYFFNNGIDTFFYERLKEMIPYAK